MKLKVIIKTYSLMIYYLFLIFPLIGLLLILNLDNLNLKEYFAFLAFVFSLSFITQRYSESKFLENNNKLQNIYFKISKNFLFISLILFLVIITFKLYLLKINYYYFLDITYYITILGFSIALISFLHNIFYLSYIIFKELRIVSDFKNFIFKIKNKSLNITIKDTNKMIKK